MNCLTCLKEDVIMRISKAFYEITDWDLFWYEKNIQGDIVAIYNASGVRLATYVYDAWGNHSVTYTNGGASTAAQYNPFRYRGYYYDTDLGMYYLQSRYYDPNTYRFINADGYVSTGQGILGNNMFAYCGNNPVNRIDPTGNAWYHWALGAAIVVACAAATVITCGGFAAAATAVCLVGNGIAAATTASTIAAASFIGSATIYGSAVLIAASTSHSVDEFNDQGNWGTVGATAVGGLAGGLYGYGMAKSQLSNNVSYNFDGSKNEKYMNKRGWDDAKISYAINNGKQGVSINMANQAECTAYRYPGTNNQYVVIENGTRSIVQLSDLNDPGWIPDPRIIWDP